MLSNVILRFKKSYFLCFIVILVAIIYLPWFSLQDTLSSGDWPYLYTENIENFKYITETPFIWVDPYYQWTAKIGLFFSFPWEITEKIFWFFPFILISIFSSWKFGKYFLDRQQVSNNSDLFTAIGVFIYTANTYILMIVGGGQMGVAMAYAFAPLVLLRLVRVIEDSSVSGQEIKNQSIDKLRTKFKISTKNSKLSKKLFIASLVSGIQLMFDPRIFLITLLGFFIYSVFSLIVNKSVSIRKISSLIFVLAVAVSLNLFWIIPNIDFYQSSYTQAAISADSDFLSFASLSNTISLLHPNWPENIFGKTGFMKPEFMGIPILAFISLLFVSRIYVKNQKESSNSTNERFNNQIILFFASVAIIGAFLAKGVNPPIGQIYDWFSGLPGSALFRDPTKFYLLVALSYSILIPFAIRAIYELIRSKSKILILNIQLSNKSKIFNIQNIFLALTILYLMFLVRPAFFGQLGGTFSPEPVPAEYVSFKNFLINNPRYSNILWVPVRQRFGLSLHRHQSFNLQDIYRDNSAAEMIDKLKNPSAVKTLREFGIEIVVVPYDSRGEIFLTDRKYNENLYKKTIMELESLSWLSRIESEGFGKIAVFEVTNNY